MEQKEPYSRVEIVLAILEHASARAMTVSFPGLTGTNIHKWDKLLFSASRQLGNAYHPLLTSLEKPEYEEPVRAYYPGLAEELKMAISICCQRSDDQLIYIGRANLREPHNRLNRENQELAGELCRVASELQGFFVPEHMLADPA